MHSFKFICLPFLLIFLEKSSSVNGKLQGYNEPCELYDEQSTCDDKAGLLCIDTGMKGLRCKCPSDPQFSTLYDSKRNKCVGKASNNCVPSGRNHNDTLCTDNAECTRGLYYFPICVCKKGFFETEKGNCAKVSKYEESCDEESQCDVKYGLNCKDGVCRCKYPDSFYDQESERCISHVGGNCSAETTCVQNAECSFTPKEMGPSGRFDSPLARTVVFTYNGKKGVVTKGPGPLGAISMDLRDQSMEQTCTCISGFSRTKDGFCKKSYGAICNTKDENEKCNAEEYLACVDANDGNFRCQCRNPFNERWSESKQQCVSMIGRSCRLDGSGAKCEDRAKCIQGTCECEPGTSLSPAHQTCLFDIHEPCTPGRCNLQNGLICDAATDTCQCIDSYLLYDEKSKACVAKVGASCGKLGLFGMRRSNGMMMAIEGPLIGCVDDSVCETKMFGGKMQNRCVPTADLNKT